MFCQLTMKEHCWKGCIGVLVFGGTQCISRISLALQFHWFREHCCSLENRLWANSGTGDLKWHTYLPPMPLNSSCSHQSGSWHVVSHVAHFICHLLGHFRWVELSGSFFFIGCHYLWDKNGWLSRVESARDELNMDFCVVWSSYDIQAQRTPICSSSSRLQLIL
jgi:hypothetical protein